MKAIYTKDTESELNMTEDDTESKQNIDRLQSQLNEQAGLIIRLQDGLKEVIARLDQLPKPKPKIAFVYEFPPFDKISQVKAQLFHNEPNRNGKRGGPRPTQWMLKVSFWTCPRPEIRQFANGTVLPFMFPLHDTLQTSQHDDSLLGRSLRANIEVELIGCREIRGYGKASGTTKDENQVAAITPQRQLLLAAQDWPQLTYDPQAAAGNAENKPVEIWSWRPAAA